MTNNREIVLEQKSSYLLRIHQKKIRFVLVGIWNTIFGYFAFVGLDFLFNLYLSPRYVAYMSASVISNVLAVSNAYFFHKHLTFKSKTTGKAALLEYLRFSLTYLFTFLFGLILLPILVEVFKFDPKIAAAIITILLTIISYISHNKFSFRHGR